MTVTHKLNMNLDKPADLPRINVVQGTPIPGSCN